MRRCCAPQHWLCAGAARCGAAEAAPSRPAPIRRRHRISRSPPTPAWPATPGKPASSSISTRPIQLRAFALADPYRVVVDIPAGQLSSLPAGRRQRRARAGQGVPLRPGDAGRLADRVRSDRSGQDRQILCAGRRQRPAAAAGARTRSRSTAPPSCSRWRPKTGPNCGRRSPMPTAAVAAGGRRGHAGRRQRTTGPWS